MDHFTVSDPTCRTDLSLFLSHHDVDHHDHFRVVTNTDTHVLSQPDERLEVGTDSAALWHDEGCTRIAFEHIEEVEWQGDTIAQREDANIEMSREECDDGTRLSADMGDAFTDISDETYQALRQAKEQNRD